MADNGPWLDPHQNKKKNRLVKNGIQGKGNIIKFFISNLPEGCTPWELSEFVKVFGEVAGAYVAKKKDKFGNRFGFISFSNVRDVKDLERALNGTKMGNSKLKVNVARFAVENANLLEKPVEIKKGKKPEYIGVPQGNLQSRNQAFIKEGGGRLFSDLFQMGNQSTKGSSSMQHQEGTVVEVVESIVAFPELVGTAAVGRCVNLRILNNLYTLLVKAGVREFSLSYMGGLSMMIKFPCVESCNNFVGNRSLWQEWFSSVDCWRGQSFPFERIAWLKVVGVPIHLAVDEVYDSVARKFGKIVQGSERMPEDVDLLS